jgi:hypothetical protein
MINLSAILKDEAEVNKLRVVFLKARAVSLFQEWSSGNVENQ